MAGRAFVSRFSPNRTDPALLEAIFVQRHKLAEAWLDRLRDSILAAVKHHLLAVGPRGCGKSHLVALLIGRLRNDPAVCERVRIAWLPEDETTPSFWKFLLRILRALNAEYGDEFPTPPNDQLANVADDRRSSVLTDYLLNKLDGRALLVVVENVDDVMRSLKTEGQRRWRAFLQEHPVTVTLATAQRLTKDVSNRDRPFFNFFQIEHLRALSADEALLLLRKIAEQINNAPLVSFLETPTGRARVRAIRHIAGGSHRVFIILSEFATREKLDDLVTAFEELLDELTPYYQERLRWLPDQQREIVEFLCRQKQTVQVKEIAAELFLSEQTAAAQLKSLRDKGYVTSQSVGRESRYELAEPLMRLCIEVKDPQREPIRLIVEFLRVWYDQPVLEARLKCLPVDADLERRFFQAAIQAHRPGVPGPVEAALDEDLAEARATGDAEKVVRVLIEVAATADTTGRCIAVASELSDFGRYEEALGAYDRAIELEPGDAIPWSNKGSTLQVLGRYEEALDAVSRAIELSADDASGWTLKGLVLSKLGRHEEALDVCDRVIELDPDSAINWATKSYSLYSLGRHEQGLDALDRALELEPDAASAWALKGHWLKDLGRHTEALAACSRGIEIKSDAAFAWREKGDTLTALRRDEEALAAYDRLITLDSDDASAWIRKGHTLNKLARYEEALVALDRAIELEPHDAYSWDCKGDTLSVVARHEEALAAYDRAIELKPDYHFSWNSKGRSLSELGSYAEAVTAYGRAIELKPEDADAWDNRGRARVQLGQIRSAVQDFRHAIELDGNFSGAFEGLAKAHLLLGDWDEAERVLSKRFRLPSSPSKQAQLTELPDLVAAIFRASSDAKVWTYRVGRLVELAWKAQADLGQQTAGERAKPDAAAAIAAAVPLPLSPLTMLGASLVYSLTIKDYSAAKPDALGTWADMWHEVAKRHPDLSFAARLFGVGIRYLQTNDERVLLDLVQEERSLLRKLFGLETASDDA